MIDLPHAPPRLAAALAMALLAGVALSGCMRADAHEARSAAVAGDLSDAGLGRALADMDPATRALALRFDPKLHADLGDRPAGWAAFDLAHPPVMGWNGLSSGDLRQVNALIPKALAASPPAKPFVLRASAGDRARAEHCLAQAVYYEAATESAEGQAAVAQTVLNRLRHPAFPKSICGVVYEGSRLATGCQFSFTCDGSLGRAPIPALWAQAQAVARRALNGSVAPEVGEATHYHADYVSPYWRASLVKVTQIGAHIFYRWPGLAGEPAAFDGRYAGGEAHISEAVLGDPGPQVLLDHALATGQIRVVDAGVAGQVRTVRTADTRARSGSRMRVEGVIVQESTDTPSALDAAAAAQPAASTAPAS